jgi:hypothetical protein
MGRQYYLWSAGGGKVAAEISTDLIARLQQIIASETDSGAEIGGLLLGRCISDERITIEDFELLPSEHRRGLTFTLSQSDRRNLASRLRAKHRGLHPVGTFRTHLRQGLYMDQYDFDLMSAHFADPQDVALLVRPSDLTAGLFVWEQGDVHRQNSYREFLFDPGRLPLATSTDEASFAPRPEQRNWLPTAAKVALLAATVGLVVMLATHSRSHQNQTVQLAPIHAAPVAQSQLEKPVDPDIRAVSVDEMHVKLSPFAPPPKPEPAPLPDSAANIPASLPATPLKPEPPQFVSLVSVQPAQPGVLSRSISKIPILNLLHRTKFKSGDHFMPARPVRQVKPRLPAEMAGSRPGPVDIKIWVDESGHVTRAQPLNDSDPEIAEMASLAALKWTFEPARLADRPVSSELVMHFRFAQSRAY